MNTIKKIMLFSLLFSGVVCIGAATNGNEEQIENPKISLFFYDFGEF